MAKVICFECSRCSLRMDAQAPPTVCTHCAGALLVRYDFSAVAGVATRNRIGVEDGSCSGTWRGMWRYRVVLPPVEPVTLGEGWTPLVPSRRFPNAWLKLEGANPTGSFKARGLAMAVTMARHYGMRTLALASAGNAGGALAAYAAAAGMEAHIFMPRDVPLANQVECRAYGAHLTLVDGLISDCGKLVGEHAKREGWFNISTLKEPFRVEGKKTMGYEIVEQLGWEYPDAVFYPTGGGVGLIGLWKAFEELEQLGWVKGNRPKMIAVQSEGCAPVARAFERGHATSEPWTNAQTFAAGLRVPSPYAGTLMLEIVRQSGGMALALSDDVLFASLRDWAAHEGQLFSPEGAASTAAYARLIATGFLSAEDRVVLFSTAAGNKYTDVIDAKMRSLPAVEAS